MRAPEPFPLEGLLLAQKLHLMGYTLRIRAPRYSAGRNEKCPCGSGVKFKRCHGR